MDKKNVKKTVLDHRKIDFKEADDKIEDFKEKMGHLFTYYTRFFPFAEIHQWLNYQCPEKFNRREFSVTLLRRDTFIRFLAFDELIDFKSKVVNFSPVKIDIGAIHNDTPKKGNSALKIRPIQRELVFDIDLSDYNDVRLCCNDSDVCQLCWSFAAVACKILDSSFREDFGWNKILWVYSGRRGIHAWVCDEKVRRLSKKERKQILKFYLLKRSSAGVGYDLGTKDLYPSVRRTVEIAEKAFVKTCVVDQQILISDKGLEKFVSLLPSTIREKVRALISDQPTNVKKWFAFRQYWSEQSNLHSAEWQKRPHLLKEIVLYYMYPRIDCDVTESPAHLLKAPFSPHPSTNLVCTPFDPLKVDYFQIDQVPSIHDLANVNIHEIVQPHINVRRFAESLEVFRAFLKSSEDRNI